MTLVNYDSFYVRYPSGNEERNIHFQELTLLRKLNELRSSTLLAEQYSEGLEVSFMNLLQRLSPFTKFPLLSPLTSQAGKELFAEVPAIREDLGTHTPLSAEHYLGLRVYLRKHIMLLMSRLREEKTRTEKTKPCCQPKGKWHPYNKRSYPNKKDAKSVTP